MIPLQLVTRWNVYGVAPNRGYIQVNKNEGIHEVGYREGAIYIEVVEGDIEGLDLIMRA
jgi:hypothetical protein